jgi:transcriptional regulator with GAF, ATPase, and Fis domain
VRLDAAAALAETAREINSQRTVAQTLDAIVHAARLSIPGFEHVGVSVIHRKGQIETKAATGHLVWDLDAVQCQTGEGPCVDAVRAEPVVVVEHLRRQLRWPRYVPAAVQAGVLSQLVLQLFVTEESLGELTLYSTSSETIDPDAPYLAELFASHAATALGHARETANLSEAMASRQQIGIVVGLLMAHYRVDSARAFQFLTRASSTSELGVPVVAQEIFDTAEETYCTQSQSSS